MTQEGKAGEETEDTDSKEPASCCSKCVGRSFCSPNSGSCYDWQKKDYYKSCPVVPCEGSDCPLGMWSPTSAKSGTGRWCEIGKAPDAWVPLKSCPTGLASSSVKILTYNLFWWNLFGRRGGNGGSAGRLIANNGPYDIMGFQECDDVHRVLRDAGLSDSHSALVAGHATAIAYKKDTWQELSSGKQDVGEDNRHQYYGRRGVGWARLKHKDTGKVVFLVNHHGPLQVNTGGKCGGEATAYNMLKVIALHAGDGDTKILLGDLNADTNSATQRTLKGHMHQAARDWVDAIYASCPGTGSRNLGNGGSDHNAIEATFRI